MIKPITPNEAIKNKISVIPDEVIEIFNTMILENLNGNVSVVHKYELVRRIIEAMKLIDNTFTREDIFKKHYLDIEDIFRDAGWSVNYDSPLYNETYESTYTFTFKK